MIICICHRVSDRDIAHAVRAGCASFTELQRDLAVSTACGKCRDCAIETFHLHAGGTGPAEGSCVAVQASTGGATRRPALARAPAMPMAATA